jgi:hypothetical protein
MSRRLPGSAWLPGSAFDDEQFDQCKAIDYEAQPGFSGELPILPSKVKRPSCSQWSHMIRSLIFDVSKRSFQKRNKVVPVQSLLLEYHCMAFSPKQCNESFIIIQFVNGDETQTSPATENFVERVLRRGIDIDNDRFSVVGLSNSQLRDHAFCFMRGSSADVQEFYCKHVLVESRALSSKSPAKLVKHRGLMFTSCRFVLQLPPDTHVSDVDDSLSTATASRTDVV